MTDGLVYKPPAAMKSPRRAANASPDLPIAEVGDGALNIENPLAKYQMPILSKEEFEAAPGSATIGGGGKVDKIIAEAKKFVGTPYKWGGTSPLGFDCSGFTQYVFRQLGVELPRISYQQGNGGTAVNPKDARPGDLIFWDNSPRNPGADHVAIYLGNGQVISAPKPGDRVKIQAIYGNYFVRRYL